MSKYVPELLPSASAPTEYETSTLAVKALNTSMDINTSNVLHKLTGQEQRLAFLEQQLTGLAQQVSTLTQQLAQRFDQLEHATARGSRHAWREGYGCASTITGLKVIEHNLLKLAPKAQLSQQVTADKNKDFGAFVNQKGEFSGLSLVWARWLDFFSLSS